METMNDTSMENPRSNSKKLIVIAGTVLLLLIVLSTFFLIKSNKSTVKSDSIVAKVGNEVIHTSDVKKEAAKLYKESAINDQIVNNAVDPTIEKKILDQESARTHISISDAEINQVLQYRNPGKTVSTVYSGYTDSIKYELLKDKIIQNFVNSRTAFVIGFWVRPYSEEASMTDADKQTNRAIRTDGIKALNEIELAMKNGQQPVDIVQAMIQKYPILQTKLGINNYIYLVNKDKSRMTKPAVYVYQSGNGIWKLFFDTLFSMKNGDITKIVNSAGSGGSVIHLIDSNNAKYSTYEEWLAAQKKDLVK